jgi:predicted nucleic acid-binding protein
VHRGGTCAAVDLALYSALRDLAALPQLAALRRAAFVWLPTDDQDLCRALDIQAELASGGYRVADWPVLLVAAVAERYGVTVLHHAADLDRIARVTGQATEWVVPDGRG